ncbi:hypothetical protein J6590_010596 [Homalodisca vitripennis]|nr:hypothetical protein J6590_010596 [Homalodisca vitripennis]
MTQNEPSRAVGDQDLERKEHEIGCGMVPCPTHHLSSLRYSGTTTSIPQIVLQSEYLKPIKEKSPQKTRGSHPNRIYTVPWKCSCAEDVENERRNRAQDRGGSGFALIGRARSLRRGVGYQTIVVAACPNWQQDKNYWPRIVLHGIVFSSETGAGSKCLSPRNFSSSPRLLAARCSLWPALMTFWRSQGERSGSEPSGCLFPPWLGTPPPRHAANLRYVSSNTDTLDRHNDVDPSQDVALAKGEGASPLAGPVCPPQASPGSSPRLFSTTTKSCI